MQRGSPAKVEEDELRAVGRDDLEPGVVERKAVGHVEVAQEDLLPERRRLHRRLGRQADTVDTRTTCGTAMLKSVLGCQDFSKSFQRKCPREENWRRTEQ